MFKLRMDKEAWSIAGAILIGFTIFLATGVEVIFAPDKVFGDHLWAKLLTAGLIVLVLGFLVFRYRGKKAGRN